MHAELAEGTSESRKRLAVPLRPGSAALTRWDALRASAQQTSRRAGCGCGGRGCGGVAACRASMSRNGGKVEPVKSARLQPRHSADACTSDAAAADAIARQRRAGHRAQHNLTLTRDALCRFRNILGQGRAL
eukprot:361389-Chlamydomonas_euryale.AAC.1